MEIEVDVDATGRPVIIRVALVGASDRPIRSNEVRSYSLEKLMTMALSDVTLRVFPASEAASGIAVDVGDGNTYVFDRPDEAWQRAVIAVRQRNIVSGDRLEDVARFYKAGGVKAVERTST